jgi:murein L,D-transpeptidase YcbB/YkuD
VKAPSSRIAKISQAVRQSQSTAANALSSIVSGWGRAEIDAAIATGQRHDIKLQNQVPVAWIYLTGWMSRDQIVQFRSDIYDQDQQLLEATAEEKAFFDQAK